MTTNQTSIAECLVAALRAVPLTDTEKLMVRGLRDHPWSDAKELSAYCGMKGQAINLFTGALVTKRAEWLPVPDTGPACCLWLNYTFRNCRLAIKSELEGVMATALTP